ncbi:MAG: hypothetical protein IJQ61_09315 [Bacteroidales bacterium]|nr:hypothetical protein [Bacteroidales bacterium]MBR0246658.1 hypothetical protein [Bacteroidales bacterium]
MMSASDIISIIDIVASVGLGIWIATAITKSQTKERFLKDYFTNEINGIKDDCKTFFDEICYDKKSANDIKIGFRLLSMRVTALESNLETTFKKVNCNLRQHLTNIQLEVTGCDDFNNQFKEEVVSFSAAEKNAILENRHQLLTEFSKSVVIINKARVKR